MIISDIVYKKNVYIGPNNKLYAVREDNTGMTIIQLQKNTNKDIGYIANLKDWQLLVRWTTNYGDFQDNIKYVTDNFAFGPLRFSSDTLENFRMETVHTFQRLYNFEVMKPGIRVSFNAMLIWEEIENNFIDEDTEITCELLQHPINNGIVLKIIFPEYYIVIASLRDEY